MALIECRNLCKDYELGIQVVHALRSVTLDIDTREFVSIMGPSGSGKSTLMNLLGALDTPTSGSLHINGRDIMQLDSDALAVFRNRSIGFVFQNFNLLARTTALGNVQLPLLYDKAVGSEGADRARASLERVGLGDRMDHQPSQLSGGQQQRVAIARALANNPEIILADEPTGALDTETSGEILELFHELNDAGITIIIVTHDPEVAAVSKRIIAFRDGHLVDPEEVFGATAA